MLGLKAGGPSNLDTYYPLFFMRKALFARHLTFLNPKKVRLKMHMLPHDISIIIANIQHTLSQKSVIRPPATNPITFFMARHQILENEEEIRWEFQEKSVLLKVREGKKGFLFPLDTAMPGTAVTCWPLV